MSQQMAPRPTVSLAEQEKASAIAEVCACANLRRASRIITRRFDDAMRATGLRSTQMSILNEIARMGEAPVAQLAVRLAMDASTLTRNLTPLERDGVIAATKT
ncbi:MAG: MarR family transcriptional regulator, partial [Alphaproteobacteria bacterium]